MLTSDVRDRAPQLRLFGSDLTEAGALLYPTRQLQGALCYRLLLFPTALFALAMWMTPARADVLGDCVQAKMTAKTIDRCTQIIEAGQPDKNGLAWAHFNRGTALGMKG
jgi:hypothetical protein